MRARKRDRVREQLTEAAFTLFLRDGYDATTVDAIAAAAEVSRRTFFRYFGTKEDVLLAWVELRDGALRAALAERPRGEPPLATVRAALAPLVAYYEAAPERWRAIMRLSAAHPVLGGRRREKQARWERTLAEGVAAALGVGADALRAQLAARVGLAAFETAVEAWMRDDPPGALSRLVDDAFALLARDFGS
ncbi:TetR family transcriptional regulator [Gemmatimonadetes bacterium T265]|nr:TetR family transcriptional regulator [Gemmatimonadetes bacterium T265]